MTNYIENNQVERINGNIVLRQRLKKILSKNHIENFNDFFKHFTDNYFEMVIHFRKDIEKVNSKLLTVCLYFPQYGIFKEDNKIKILVFLPIGTFEVTTMEIYKCQ